MFLSLDAEKAFSAVHWPFLEAILIKFGLGPKYRHWVKLLYTDPRAWVRVNGILSRDFAIRRGTRQGCPLSPLLFALTVGIVACEIRQMPAIRGFQCTSTDPEEEKISLYADDILLYVAQPATTIPILFKLLGTYGSLSG